MKSELLLASILYRAMQGKLVPQLESEPKVARIGDAPEDMPFSIPEKWKWVRLKDVCTYIQRGKSPRYSEIKKIPVIAQKCNQWDGLHIEKAKFIDPESLSSYKQERILQNGDILWNSTGLGTLGRLVVYKVSDNPFGIAVADGHVTVVRTSAEYLDSSFLYWYLRSPSVQNGIEDLADGSTKQKELSTKTIREYLVPLPPLEEQRRIAERLNELKPLLNEYDCAQKLLDQLVLAFPDRIKASILQEAIQGRLVSQLDVEPDVLQIGDAPEDVPFSIPEKWKWVRLKDVCTYIQRGKSPRYSEIKKIPVIAQKCNQWDGLHIEKAKFIDPESLSSYKQERILQNGDILWNSTGLGTLGRLVVYKVSDNPFGIAVADGHVTVVRTSTEFLDGTFLYWYLRSPFVQNVIEDLAEGSTKQKELTTKTIREYLVPLPPLREQRRIVARLRELKLTLDEYDFSLK